MRVSSGNMTYKLNLHTNKSRSNLYMECVLFPNFASQTFDNTSNDVFHEMHLSRNSIRINCYFNYWTFSQFSIRTRIWTRRKTNCKLNLYRCKSKSKNSAEYLSPYSVNLKNISDFRIWCVLICMFATERGHPTGKSHISFTI